MTKPSKYPHRAVDRESRAAKLGQQRYYGAQEKAQQGRLANGWRLPPQTSFEDQMRFRYEEGLSVDRVWLETMTSNGAIHKLHRRRQEWE